MFDTKGTVWEALESALAIGVARPAIDAGELAIITDKKKPVIQFVFNNANIIKGSFQATYTIDSDGDSDAVEVQYRNPSTFAPEFVVVPALTADGNIPINPIKMELFGCTSK